MTIILDNSPVATALLQIKYKSESADLMKALSDKHFLSYYFPIKRNNISLGLNLGNSSIPLGQAKLSAISDAKIDSYLFTTTDQLMKLSISNDTITIIDENKYIGWESFKMKCLDILKIIAPQMNTTEIIRTSIRYVNRIELPDFNVPSDYIRTIITSVSSEPDSIPYPLRQYNMRLLMDIPNSDIYSIVNHNISPLQNNAYIYTFDIDVLDRQCLVFDIITISSCMDKLREIKNNIFFSNLTTKTLDLCK